MNWWDADPVVNDQPMQMAKSTASWWENDPIDAPKEESWGEWAVNSIKGRKDPKFDGVGTVFDQFPNDLHNLTSSAATMGASDAQMADVIQKGLGDRFIRRETDANGYEVFVTKGPDGKEQRGYLNKPGLDSQDVARGIRGALPYALTGGAAGVAGRGAGMLANSALQGLAGWTTSAGGDVGLQGIGSQQGIEGEKGATAAVLGAAGPILGKLGSAFWTRFVREPRYYNRSTGMLTDKGKEAAQRLGIDPETMIADGQKMFGRTYAADPAEAAKMVDSGQLDFGVPQTMGQRTKDAEQLMIEKAMRSGTYGSNAKDMVTGLDAQQAEGVNRAVRETIPRQMAKETVRKYKGDQAWSQGIDDRFGGQTMEPGAWGQNLQETVKDLQRTAKQGASAAWDSIGVMRPTPQALGELPTTLRTALGDMAPDQQLHPTTWRMLETLDAYTKGDAMTGRLDILGPNNGVAIDAMRRRLLGMSQAAGNRADATMAGRLYGAFNDWIGESAQKQLLLGNVDDAAKLVKARDVTQAMKRTFEPKIKGMKTPAGRILEKVLEQDTPERIVDVLFAGPRAGIKDGSLEAIRLMNRAAKQYGDAASQVDVMTSLKVAHWSKLVQGKDGQLLDYKVMLNNIRTAMTSQKTLVNEMYSPSEIRMIARVQKMLEGITYKDPNPSGTATGIAVLTKQLFGKIMSAFGPVGQMAVEYSGLPRAYGAALARRATSQVPPSVRLRGPNLGPVFSATGSQISRQRAR